MDIDPEPGENNLEAVERRVPGGTQHLEEIREARDNLQVGDVVLVVDQNAPRGIWDE